MDPNGIIEIVYPNNNNNNKRKKFKKKTKIKMNKRKMARRNRQKRVREVGDDFFYFLSSFFLRFTEIGL